MLDFIAWYVLVIALGWIVFPLLFHTLSDIPGRGFTFSKIFGLLFWGYLYWILGRLGFTANNLAGLVFTLTLGYRILYPDSSEEWEIRLAGLDPIQLAFDFNY